MRPVLASQNKYVGEVQAYAKKKNSFQRSYSSTETTNPLKSSAWGWNKIDLRVVNPLVWTIYGSAKSGGDIGYSQSKFKVRLSEGKKERFYLSS